MRRAKRILEKIPLKLNGMYSARHSVNKNYIVITSAYSPSNGMYIGSIKLADFLQNKKGIDFNTCICSYKESIRDYEDLVCNVAFSPKLSKWCGWSHRAIACFGIGDKLFDEFFEIDLLPESEKEKYSEYIKEWKENGGYKEEYVPFTLHGYKIIGNLDEAKQAAINFADYVL